MIDQASFQVRSRITLLLENIVGANNDLEPPGSRIEDILLCILNRAPYEGGQPQSRVEKLLLCILNGTKYVDAPQSRTEQILLCKLNGCEYTGETKSQLEELLAQWTKQGRSI